MRWLGCTLSIFLLLAACTEKDSVTPYNAIADTVYIEDTIEYPLDSIPDTRDTITIPLPLSVSQGHLVIFVDTMTSGSYQITYLSLRDWSHMASANNESYGTQALDSAAVYSESDPLRWYIPSEAEARRLKSTFAEGTQQLAQLQQALGALQADTIQLHSGSSKVRYLCADAAKTYSHCSNSNITTAGASTRTYHMRLLSRDTIQRQ